MTRVSIYTVEESKVAKYVIKNLGLWPNKEENHGKEE